jgi:hypothetical protein
MVNMVAIGNTIKPLLEAAPFCQRVWKKIDLSHYVRKCGYVTHHKDLNGINHYFLGAPSNGFKKPFKDGMTAQDVMVLTDVEFKALPKTTEKLISYRCIGEKPEFLESYKRYSRSLEAKKGDIVYMPEYAYSATNIKYAKGYLKDGKGILYEIEIPPDARVSRGAEEIVFPRSSRFECLEKKEKDGLTIIKLKYILPFDHLA